MRRAIELARKGHFYTRPNPLVGCVLVKDNQVVAEGYHAAFGKPHAEVNALGAAQEQGIDPADCEAFVTLEPCSHYGHTPPCAGALVERGIRKVTIACQDPNPLVAGQGIAWLRRSGIPVTTGVCAEEARTLNQGFFTRFEQQRPRVKLKSAASIDGRISTASGESKWITSAASRADGHWLRAAAGAIVTGIETVLADDPALTARPSAGAGPATETLRQPLRVVLDRKLRLPPGARIIGTDAACHVFTRCDHAEKRRMLEAAGVTVRVLSAQTDAAFLQQVLQILAGWEINDVLVEAGGRLIGSFIAAGLMDSWVVYQAPVLLGEGGRSLATVTVADMQQRYMFALHGVCQIGDDVRLEYCHNHHQ